MEQYSKKLKLSSICVAIAAVLVQTNLTYGSEKANKSDELTPKAVGVAKVIVEDEKIITEKEVQPIIESAPVTIERFEKVMQELEKIAQEKGGKHTQLTVVLKKTVDEKLVPEFYDKNDKRNPLRTDKVVGHKVVLEKNLSDSQLIEEEVEKPITERVEIVRDLGTIIFYKEIANALAMSKSAGKIGKSAFTFLPFDATLSGEGDSSKDEDFTVTELLEEFYESVKK
jgi:hypothetical protein